MVGENRKTELKFGIDPEQAEALIAHLSQRHGQGPRRFRAPDLGLEMTAGTAFQAIALAALEQIAGNAEDLRERPRAEVIHQMRVGARRLQSTLSTFKPIISDRRMDVVKTELTWLLTELAPARNLDVFLSGAFARASRAKGDKDLAALGKRLRMARKAAYARALKAAESDRFSALLLDILSWIEVGPWMENRGKAAALRDALIGEFAARALKKALVRVRKRARRFHHLSREARHKLRIRAKTLRYAADVFDGLFTAHPKRARRFLRRIRNLLDCLGELNDIVTGEGLIADGPTPKCLTDRQTSREKQLIGLAGHALDAFGETGRFWPKQA